MDKCRRVILASLATLVLLAGTTLAQKKTEGGQKKCPLPDADSSSGTMKQGCPLEAKIMKGRFFLDGPGALYGQAETLGLSEAQKSQLADIQKQARAKALAVLTAEQKTKLGDIPNEPVSMKSLRKKMGSGMMSGKSGGTCPMGDKKSEAGATMHHQMNNSKAEQISEQTTCPVMGGKINKSIATEYKGKKVYFCCPSCELKFEKNPEKYVSKLPQFNN